MSEVFDVPLEKYERMARQRHPQVVPMCLAAIEHAREEAFLDMLAVSSVEAEGKLKIREKIGLTILSTGSIAFASEALARNFTMSRLAVAAGAAILAGQVLNYQTHKIDFKNRVNKTAEKFVRLSNLHAQILDTAVEVGTIKEAIFIPD